MTFVAVTTVQDRGAAEVLRELLDERGIPVELKEIAPTAYMAILTPTSIEIRVPPDRFDDAAGALADYERECGTLGKTAFATNEAEVERAVVELTPPRRSLKRKLLYGVVALVVLYLTVVVYTLCTHPC